MEVSQDMLVQYGLMSKLSTGNSLLDALLVMLVPVLVNQVLPHITAAVQRLRNRCTLASAAPYVRVITHKQSACRPFYFDGDSDDPPPNHKLQRAILVHLNSLPELLPMMETADVQLCKCKGPQQNNVRGNSGLEDDDTGAPSDTHRTAGTDNEYGDDDDSDSDNGWFPGMELEQFQVALVPPRDVWVDVEPGLQFKRSEWTESTADKQEEVTTTFTLTARRAEQVDAFITRAFEAYKLMLKGEQKESRTDRYLYLPVSLERSGGSSSGDDSAPTPTYRRYKLSDDKSFSNFFHPDKDDILSLINNFSNKTGKFSIQGYPHKLGFLLHGPPGTGKTSFIKCLAAHTGRSIISIPLARITTNQQLMDFMYEERIKVEGLDMRVPLPFNKVIYVMEDVDAASEVVRKRGAPDPLAALMASLRNECDKGDMHAVLKVEPAVHSAADSRPLKASSKTSAAGGDALNLAGLLNVLDGVVDTPGRLIVMTTNHPESLDPALIRPGRINKKLYMGLVAAAEALAMVQHYFGDELQEQQEWQLTNTWVDGVVSPAALEALCAECESVDVLLSAVGKLMPAAAAAAAEHSTPQQPKTHEQQQQAKQQKQCAGAGGSCGSNSSTVFMIRAASCSASFVSQSVEISASSSRSPFAAHCND